MTKNEHLKYHLETLASYEPSDLENPEFDVAYEDENGYEGFHTVCCTEVAKRAVERIKELETELSTQKVGLLEDLKNAIQPAGLINSVEGINTIRAITSAIDKVIQGEKISKE